MTSTSVRRRVLQIALLDISDASHSVQDGNSIGEEETVCSSAKGYCPSFSLPSPPGETYVCVDLFVKLDIHAGEEGPIESHFSPHISPKRSRSIPKIDRELA